MQLSLDITVHHFGSPDGMRDYGRRWVPVPVGAGTTYADLTCQQNAAYFLQLRFHGWAPVDDDWWSTTLELQGPAGEGFGTRPALVLGKPYDVPTYTTFTTERDGLFSVGLRTVGAG